MIILVYICLVGSFVGMLYCGLKQAKSRRNINNILDDMEKIVKDMDD